MRSTSKKALVWPIRAVLALAAVLVSFVVIMPAMGGVAGLLLGALVCAAAIGADIAITARLVDEPLEHVAAKRAVMVDRMLSPRDAKPLGGHRPQLEEGETVDAEIVIEPGEDEEPPRLLPR